MPDQIAFPALALLAVGLIALALVWPQGEGARSAGAFGRPLHGLERVLGAKTGAPTVVRGAQPKDAPPVVKGEPRRAGRP
jgi:hypothetical protein